MADSGYSDVNLSVILNDAIPAQWRATCETIDRLQEELIQARRRKAWLEGVAGSTGISLGNGSTP